MLLLLFMRRNTVLVVEDDSSIRETLRLALEMNGYSVYSAADGKEGLDLLTRIPRPCVILLDLMMPVMDGWRFIKALETSPALKDIPVVAVTAFDDKLKSIKVRQILRKPFNLDLLLQIVKQYSDAA